MRKRWVALIGIALFLVVAYVIGSNDHRPQASAEQTVPSADSSGNPEHDANFKALPVDMARIYDSLRDQKGVKWGTVTGTRNGTTVCGHVNAHNEFGGYTGMRAFIFDEAVGDPGVPNMGAYVHWQEHPGFQREWKHLCEGDPNAVTYDGQALAGAVEALAPTEREAGQ